MGDNHCFWHVKHVTSRPRRNGMPPTATTRPGAFVRRAPDTSPGFRVRGRNLRTMEECASRITSSTWWATRRVGQAQAGLGGRKPGSGLVAAKVEYLNPGGSR